MRKTANRIPVIRLLILGLFAAFVLFGRPQSASAAGGSIRSCTVTLSKITFTYTGETFAPKVTVKDGDTTLTEGVDYELYNAEASTVGTHEITVVGIGNYTDQTTASFEILKKKNKLTWKGDTTFYTYSGPSSFPILVFAEEDAPISYSTTTKGASITRDGRLGTDDGFLGTVKIKATAAETEVSTAVSKTFSIKIKLDGVKITKITNEGSLPDVLPENNHTAKVYWATDYDDYNMLSVDGFQLRYSRSKTFASGVYKIKIPMLYGLGTMVSSCSLSSHLVKGKTFYFQLRTYKTALDGKKYYSAWSKTVSHKVDSSPESFYKGKKPKNGETWDYGGITYKYKNKTLTATGMKYSSKTNQVIIPDTISIYGKKYPVTAIAANAFKNAHPNGVALKITIGKNVKTIGKNGFADNTLVDTLIIKSTKLTAKSIGKNAFKNLGKRDSLPLTVKVPKSKKSNYKTILKKAGITKKVTWKSL